jgi:3-methyladenine DNA glycosylase AlkD
VRKYQDASLKTVGALLKSPWHEDRSLALLILVRKYEKGDEEMRRTIYDLYLRNVRYINNWDLVDQSAPQIVGGQLKEGDRRVLARMAKSPNVWERRIAVLATFRFIRHDDFDDSLRLAEVLLSDEHDLMHKAVGWMLREVGKRDGATERKFLDRHYPRMPRTMLRYAIEKFPERERLSYLKGTRKVATPS